MSAPHRVLVAAVLQDRPPPAAERRRGGRRVARGAPVVRAVLDAAMDELSREGYGALTVEKVALRAGVNKTTVYRRWASRPGLVAAALSSIGDTGPALESSEDVRADLLAVARRTARAMSSRRGQGILRTLLGGCADPELVALALSSRRQFEASALQVIEQARRRGALRADADPRLLLQVIGGWVVNALFRERVGVGEDDLALLVDLLLDGARACAVKGARPRRAGAPRRG